MSLEVQQGLVSIIIPCYNQGQWVAEAVESALNQSYLNKEVIVVDDGSTDDSLRAIRKFGTNITVVESEHCNGNVARNKGFALSRGEYIQFLDADDYVLSEKIAVQVKCLEESGCDFVYGDWRHIYCDQGKPGSMGAVVKGQVFDDLLEEVLKGWWTAPVSILCKRSAVIKAGGWDETFTVAQDRDFLIAMLLSNAKGCYQPGCHSVYRRHSRKTVSTGNLAAWLEGHIKALAKAEERLEAEGRLSAQYAKALALGYFHIARNYYDKDIRQWRSVMDKVASLNADFIPNESFLYGFFFRLLGAERAEKLASFKRRFLNG